MRSPPTARCASGTWATGCGTPPRESRADRMARLTGVSYVMLAMLARRPTSAYDLTQDIKTSMSQCMPRSSTLLYKEPKNLVAHGLAEVETQMKGRQKRAV